MQQANRRFYISCVPQLIERVQILAGDGGFICIGYAVPSFPVRTVYQSLSICDTEGLFVIAGLFFDVAKFDIAVQAPSHMHELIATFHRASGVCDHYPDAGEGAGKNKFLKSFEEIFVIVDIGLKVRGK